MPQHIQAEANSQCTYVHVGAPINRAFCLEDITCYVPDDWLPSFVIPPREVRCPPAVEELNLA